MSNIFSGLEKFGLDKLSKMEVYHEESSEEEKEGKKEQEKILSRQEKEKQEADVIFDKTYVCPVCDANFKSKTVKTGKVKLISADTDLRPKYQIVDSLKYDAIVCPRCGYGALNRFFNYMTSVQAKLIKTQISANFKGISTDLEIYSYDDAIARHKIALVNTIVKKGKISEKAYTCLKIAWLLRGKTENLPEDTQDYDKIKKQLQAEEAEFIKNAYEGFTSAFSKEDFPMCGMDEYTTEYLVADLARRCGKLEEARRWISKVLVSKNCSDRIKNRARELKELVNEQSK